MGGEEAVCRLLFSEVGCELVQRNEVAGRECGDHRENVCKGRSVC